MKIILVILTFLLFNNIQIGDITLKDDAFHSDFPLHIETWYFEALFDNNESFVFMVTSLSNGSNGFLMTGTYFYENGRVAHEHRQLHSSFYLSDELPIIIIEGDETILGYLTEKNKICYRLSYTSEQVTFDFIFENTTKGWKTQDETWLAIPNFNVTGTYSYNGTQKEVKGKGYHDHNIFFFSSPFMSRGYFNGKIMTEGFSLFWGKLMRNIFDQENFIVYSNDSYTLLNENMSISCYEYELNNGKLIPTGFLITAENEHLSINITLDAQSIHFIRLPLLHYWRYHVHAEGAVKLNNETINVDTYGIIEYMLFT